MIRYLTTGESHGKCLTAVVEGVPAGLPLAVEDINSELARRQYSFGRGERLQYIEKDRAEITSGVRWGETLGSPICLTIENQDWKNWQSIMSLEASAKDEKFRLLRPRPGHVDLAGILKFDREDTRDVLERASARETAARTAVGAICKKLLSQFGVIVLSFVKEIGGIRAKTFNLPPEETLALAEASPVRTLDKEAEAKMIEAIKKAKADGDTLGGVYAVVVHGCPVGLGSHIQWDQKLDGRLAQAILSIQAHKGVEIGRGFSMAKLSGSKVHDEIFYEPGRGYFRRTNNAGGLEGGITNGEPIIIRAALKPLSSLKKPLKSVSIKTHEPLVAEIIRSDICPVASAGIIGEAVVAIVLAQAMREKFGGDSLREMKANYDAYIEHLRTR